MYAPVRKAARFLSCLRLAPFSRSSSSYGKVRGAAVIQRRVYVFLWSRTIMYVPVRKAARSLSCLRLAPFSRSSSSRGKVRGAAQYSVAFTFSMIFHFKFSISRLKNRRKSKLAFAAVVPTRYALKLNNDDIKFFKFFFKSIGEFVVGNQHVNVRRAGEGVGFNLADFRAVKHHIQELRFFANYA